MTVFPLGVNGGFCRLFLCIVVSVASAFILETGKHSCCSLIDNYGDAPARTHSADIVCARSVETLDGASNFGRHRVTGVRILDWEGGLEEWS